MNPLPLGRCSERNSSDSKIQCHRWAAVICTHCSQSVCNEHHKLHQDDIQIRVDKLNNEINDLRQTLHRLTYEQMFDKLKDRLDRWAAKSHIDIDLKYKNMLNHYTHSIEQINIEQFRSIQLNNLDRSVGQPLTDLIHTSNQVHLKNVLLLEQQFQQIQQTIGRIISPFEFNADEKLDFDQKYSLNDCPSPMAGSLFHHHYLLIFQSKPSLSLVFIEENKNVIQTKIDYCVNDICWSHSTSVFLIATDYYLYEYYPLNNRLSQPYGKLKSTRKLWSLACNLTDVFILHQPDMTMYRRDLEKPFEKKQEWSRHELMYEKGDQNIGCIRIDEQKQILGLSIKTIDDQWRIDLFSIDNMQRIHRGSSFSNLIGINIEKCLITPLLDQNDQWLVHISTNEKYRTMIINGYAQVVRENTHHGYNSTLISRDKIAFLDSTGVEICRR